jgi:hypothetical protein
MMEDIRTYRVENEEPRREEEQQQPDWNAAPEDEVPFEIPRD